MRAYTWIIGVIFTLVIGIAPVSGVDAGWESKAAFGVGAVIAGKVLKKCITYPTCKQAGMDKVKGFLAKHPDLHPKLLGFVEKQASTKYKSALDKSPTARQNYEKLVDLFRGGGNVAKGTAGGARAGKSFTPKGKSEIDTANAERHGGVNVCENCGTQVMPGQRSQRGVTPPGNERQRDHIVPKSKGGDGDPSNGQILCRTCNLDKSDKL